MKPGSVIVDLAAPEGGNCELTVPGEDVVKHGVVIIGQTNVAGSVPMDASLLYARNCLALALLVSKAGAIAIDTSDEVVAGTLPTHAGAIHHAGTKKRLTETTDAA